MFWYLYVTFVCNDATTLQRQELKNQQLTMDFRVIKVISSYGKIQMSLSKSKQLENVAIFGSFRYSWGQCQAPQRGFHAEQAEFVWRSPFSITNSSRMGFSIEIPKHLQRCYDHKNLFYLWCCSSRASSSSSGPASTTQHSPAVNTR